MLAATFKAVNCSRSVHNWQKVLPIRRFSTEPFQPIPGRVPKKVDNAEEAVSYVKSGMRVYIHGCAATPIVLVDALAKYGKKANLRDVNIIHIHTEGPGTYAREEYKDHFRSNSLFIGSNMREAVNSGRADFTPIFLSEIPLLFRRNIVSLDVALITVSPPDQHGFCSMGTSVDCTRAALQKADYVVAQVNKFMPRTFGDSSIHMSHFDVMLEADLDLPKIHTGTPSKEELMIGQLIADNLVEDGATLQMGIGSIPDVVLSKLTNHKDLGVHSEMFSDGVVPLVELGCINNSLKNVHQGKIVGSFVFGTRRLYDFINDNPAVAMHDAQFVNNPVVISRNPRVTAINSCIEIDLTGQVVSDSIGTKMYSGVGGQVDFLRGATIGYDGLGKPILAMPSSTNKGVSKIVPFLKEGGGVVTTRAHVHYVVTEFGIAYLFGKTLRQRAYELIKIAHPDHREELEKAAFERLKVMPSP
ncbi:hypothetical protein HELRODRAFT_114851 [Helobdella robusta]|uniref:Uncharacterized protein n=1 Tax=Helobdella robusta TaxID=6412 RepID=T1EG49_HELRO|nr:hypothetical protein HELRODRAFT_114851 [Helobdella robusta]ESN95111.1 hypothetical protein HELRODRAFT_114851 [Helobdella robusta]